MGFLLFQVWLAAIIFDEKHLEKVFKLYVTIGKLIIMESSVSITMSPVYTKQFAC